MRFGIREICDVVLRAKATQKLGSRTFYKNEPVLYFDTLKTSSLEGASTTVYAQGGRGNTRLVAWEGERTLTFTMEDALISPESFSILSGAGLIAVDENSPIYVHTTSQIEVEKDNTIVLPEEACWNKYPQGDEYLKSGADIFIMAMENGEFASEPCIPASVSADHKTITCYGHSGKIEAGDIVFVDYYVKRTGGAQVIEITADKFGGNYYLEASTLFRRESDGVDMPAEFIIPNCKVQSNFTFSMSSSGDPSTFTFTMDAFPDYTKFDHTHKVLAAIQVINDEFGEIEATRQPCVSNEDPSRIASVKLNGAPLGAVFSFNDDSTKDAVKITVSGTDVDGTKYDTATFGTPEGLKAVEVDLSIKDLVQEGKKYYIRQENPGLTYFSGNGVIGTVKAKEYEADDLDDEYQILVTDKRGPISAKIYEKNAESGGLTLLRSINITNDITGFRG